MAMNLQKITYSPKPNLQQPEMGEAGSFSYNLSDAFKASDKQSSFI